MTSPLRIALIASSRFPIRQPFAGGLESHVWHLARALAGHGHDVSIFAAAGSDPDLGCRALEVRPLRVSKPARDDASMTAESFLADHHAYLTLMMQLIDCARDDFDIIHNHSLHYLPVAMAPMLSTPMLTTVHTPPTPWLESAVDASDGVGTAFAAVSRYTASSWSHAVADMSVVPNGIDISRWPLGPGGDDLVWFGRITPEKAPHLAIDAARRAGRPLVLAGPVSDSDYFADQVSPSLDGQIRYVGHLDQMELAALVGHAAAALVTPVWDEPYGLVAAEAMCCGTPVVAFARGGIPELVAPQAGQLVEPDDVIGMAAAVPRVTSLPRSEVRQHALDQCSAEAMLRTYLNLYRQTIDEYGEDSHDRLLRSPPGLRASRESNEHLRTAAAPDDGAEFVDVPGGPPVRRGRRVTA
jgi:glycosyltransferase involved in cell wall biosynthesis